MGNVVRGKWESGKFPPFPKFPQISVFILLEQEDEEMGREENGKKVFTVEDIIQEILDEQGYSEKENRGLTKQNISHFLTDLFNEMGLDDAKDVLKDGGKDYAFTEQEKPIIKRLIMERKKLRRNKLGEYKDQIETPDFEFAFKMANGIMGMLERRGYDNNKLNEAVERYLTNYLKNEASISNTIYNKLKNLIERNVSDRDSNLRTSEKFIWMRDMEKELDTVINKWDCIFNEFDRLMGEAIAKEIEDMYFEPHEVTIANETDITTKHELFDKCVNKYYDEWGKAQMKLIEEERENLLSERGKIEKKYTEKVQLYRTQIDKRSKNKRVCLDIIMGIIREISEIDDKIKKLDKEKNRIYYKCQDLAYDEIEGEDERLPLQKTATSKFLQQAIKNVEYKMANDDTMEIPSFIFNDNKPSETE
jgi:hypothetical protein